MEQKASKPLNDDNGLYSLALLQKPETNFSYHSTLDVISKKWIENKWKSVKTSSRHHKLVPITWEIVILIRL